MNDSMKYIPSAPNYAIGAVSRNQEQLTQIFTVVDGTRIPRNGSLGNSDDDDDDEYRHVTWPTTSDVDGPNGNTASQPAARRTWCSISASREQRFIIYCALLQTAAKGITKV